MLNCQPECFACCEYVFLLSLLCMVDAESSGISIELPYLPPYKSNPSLKQNVGKLWVEPTYIYIWVWVSSPKSAHFNVNQTFFEHFHLYNDYTHAMATNGSFLQNTPSKIPSDSTQVQAARCNVKIQEMPCFCVASDKPSSSVMMCSKSCVAFPAFCMCWCYSYPRLCVTLW